MKKVITAGLSFAMAASMLAGCSSKPAENSDSGDKRVLKFDSFSGGNGEKVFTKLAKAFEKANPDVDVQLRFEKELPDVLNKENAKGEYSDVVYYNLGQPSGYTETQLNTHEVLDISDVVKEVGMDENYANIEDIRQRLIEMFEDEAKKKNIHVRYTFNVEHKHVMADVTKVEEIFVNILSNALKYTPSNGSVEVNVDELSCDEPGYMIVRTSIMDTGIGMSQEYLEKIFESFSRERMTSSKISGTGLGMAIVKKYVDLLGGTIDVKSVLGKGSTFVVTLKYKMADELFE